MTHLYKLRGPGPWDHPFWWEPARLAKHFQGQSSDALETRYKHMMDNPPPDTGMPPGIARDAHCFGKPSPCARCVAWANWCDEATAIENELKRRRVWRR